MGTEAGGAGRRWLPVGVVLVVGALVAAGGWAASHRDRNDAAAAVDASTRVPMRVYVTDGGVGWDAEVRFDRAVTLSDARVHYGARSDTGSLWLDEESPYDDIPVETGDRVSISGGVLPDCTPGAPLAEPAVSVVERETDGTAQRHRYLPSKPLDLASAVREWCAHPPTVGVGMHSLTPEGESVVSVYVVNPGPDPVSVRVPAYADAHMTWESLDVVVPPAERGRFEIHGHDVGCEPGEIASWEDGRLLLDGEPYVLGRGDDGWC